MKRFYPLAFILTLSLLPLSASAQMTIISQDRNLDCIAEIEDFNTGDLYGYSDYSEAPDLLPYNGFILADTCEDFGFTAAEASQVSTLGPASFQITCDVYGETELYDEGFFASTAAYSYFDVVFSVAENVTWNLVGDILTGGGGSLDAVLYDENGTALFTGIYMNTGSSSLLEVGTLTPGIYSLILVAQVYEQVDSPGVFLGSQAGTDLEFRVFGDVAPVGDAFAQEQYLSAGPNPMRGTTTIAYAGAPNRNVEMNVFDVRGRLVRRLLNTGSATGQVAWDGRNNAGRRVPQGAYFVRMKSGQEVLQRKVMVVR